MEEKPNRTISVEKVAVQFKCEYAVYLGNTSVCYTDTFSRAFLIADALRHHRDTGELEKVINQLEGSKP